MRPQILAATLVAFIAASADAQQYLPSNVISPGPPPQTTDPNAGAGFPSAYAGGLVANVSAPLFDANSGVSSPTGPQLAAFSPAYPPNGSMPPNGISGAWVSGAPPQPMAAFTGYAQPGPGMDNGMAYGPQPPMAAAYPGEPQGPGAMPYGPFTAPEPVTPRWYFRGEAVWLARNNPNDRNLTSYNNSSNASDRLNNRFILDTDDLGFGLTAGMRLTLGHYLTDRTSIEGQFYGTNNWDERTGTRDFPSTAGAGPLSPYWGNGGGPFSTSAFSNSNQQFASYQSSFDSAELGIRQWLTPSMSVLLGLRFINVGDQFQLTATNNASNADAGQVGYYRTWTTNNLLGLQFGTEYTHDLFTRWLFFSIEGKAGAFLNFADQKNLLFNTDTTYDQRSARETQFSSMCDLTLAMTALVSDHLTIRGGYTFLFLDGVALAADQLDTNPTMANSRDFIADKGTMTLQGPFIGAELAW
jgi:hypothetical protein